MKELLNWLDREGNMRLFPVMNIKEIVLKLQPGDCGIIIRMRDGVYEERLTEEEIVRVQERILKAFNSYHYD